MLLRPAVLDCYIAALDITSLIEALSNCCHGLPVAIGRSRAEQANYGLRWRLCVRNNWASTCSARKQCDELSPFHAMTPHRPRRGTQYTRCHQHMWRRGVIALQCAGWRGLIWSCVTSNAGANGAAQLYWR